MQALVSREGMRLGRPHSGSYSGRELVADRRKLEAGSFWGDNHGHDIH